MSLATSGRRASFAHAALNRITRIEAGEVAASLWSFACFFCVLCGYYILRPLRDEMGVQGGVENLPWLFSATFIAMLAAVPLFGFAAARLPRRRLVPWTYLFFIANVLVFYALFASGIAPPAVARGFFIWVSVFNLFVVSMFWSFMTDLFRPEQAQRLFGVVAAGGSCGALVGPTLTASLAAPLGTANLLLVSCGFLALALACIHALLRWARAASVEAAAGASAGAAAAASEQIGGTTWSGVAGIARSPYLLGVVAYVLLYTVLFGFAYFELARLVAAEYADSAQRTALFAHVDLAVNVLTLLGQLFVVAKLVEKLGVGAALALLPALGLIGFAAIGLAPVLAVLIAFQILRRAADYAIARPAREMLFTVLGREAKYKSKNFIDTVVFRGGDAASGWVYAALKGLGLSLAGLAAAAIPGTILWLVLGLLLGRQHARLAATPGSRAPSDG
ncbi:MAG: Npt1/Npt2 family nucleotide transporter [Burkholderiales bacterium]